MSEPVEKGVGRPHHYMNVDGFCHAGDMFEAGTDFIALYKAEDMANLRMQYEASQAALSECLTENRENRQAAEYRLGLLQAVVSFVDTNGADLPLTLLESIRVELSRTAVDPPTQHGQGGES